MTLNIRGIEKVSIEPNNRNRLTIPKSLLISQYPETGGLELYLQYFSFESKMGLLFSEKKMKTIFKPVNFDKNRRYIPTETERELTELTTDKYMIGYGNFFIVANEMLTKKIIEKDYCPINN